MIMIKMMMMMIMMIITTTIFTDNRNNNNLIALKEHPMCKHSTLTLIKLRLDNHEVRKTSLSHAQNNRPNYSLMTMMIMMMTDDDDDDDDDEK